MSKKDREQLSKSLNNKRKRQLTKLENKLLFIEKNPQLFEREAQSVQESRITELANKPKFSSK